MAPLGLPLAKEAFGCLQSMSAGGEVGFALKRGRLRAVEHWYRRISAGSESEFGTEALKAW
jgi:hypothetical protein